MGLVKCPECGKEISDKSEACVNCGCPLQKKPEKIKEQVVTQKSPTVKKRTTAILLAFFLGGIGIHRFYLGKKVTGFIYLIFCWTFIPLILGIVDALCYLTMSDEAFQKKIKEYGKLKKEKSFLEVLDRWGSVVVLIMAYVSYMSMVLNLAIAGQLQHQEVGGLIVFSLIIGVPLTWWGASWYKEGWIKVFAIICFVCGFLWLVSSAIAQAEVPIEVKNGILFTGVTSIIIGIIIFISIIINNKFMQSKDGDYSS